MQNEEDPKKRLTDDDMAAELNRPGPWFMPYREVIGRFELKPGKYVMVPATAQKGVENKFMMRLYAGKPVDIEELT
jgi:hypothetical protein